MGLGFVGKKWKKEKKGKSWSIFDQAVFNPLNQLNTRPKLYFSSISLQPESVSHKLNKKNTVILSKVYYTAGCKDVVLLTKL